MVFGKHKKGWRFIMGKISYFDMAENDYQFLKKDYDEGRVGNVMCSIAQCICERYLKQIIISNVQTGNPTDVLKSHSLKALKNYIVNNIPDFSCDWKTVMQANGYYFSARYPGDDSFMVERDDVQEAWESVEEVRNATINYLRLHSQNKKNILDELKEPEEYDER